MKAQNAAGPGRAILHIDCDAFFASCEQALHPEYRGKPVVTGKERGIVAAASYEAKARGVKRGVPLWEIKKLCPDAIILPSDYETYSLFSKRMFAILRRFTPLTEEYSIDEAFCDITGFRRLYHASYETIAQRIKQTVEMELGITVSVGLSSSKVLAKLASKLKKPSGFVAIRNFQIEKYLDIPIENVWGIGPKTTAYCRALGILTALDFIRCDENFIRRHFTKPHFEIWQELRGESVYPVSPEEKADYASISKTKTFTPPSADRAYVYGQLLKNLENACIKARRHKLLARRIILFLKNQNFRTRGSEVKLTRATAYPNEIAGIVEKLFSSLFETSQRYRATGVVLCDLQSENTVQLSLFEAPVQIEKFKRIYAVVDQISARMGKHTLHLGASLSVNRGVQHLYERGDIPWRKVHREIGEGKRKHVNIPFLA